MVTTEAEHEIERILLIADVQKILGRSHASIYRDIEHGILTKPIKIGVGWRVGWPSSEISAIRKAFVKGSSQSDIKELVANLHLHRQQS